MLNQIFSLNQKIRYGGVDFLVKSVSEKRLELSSEGRDFSSLTTHCLWDVRGLAFNLVSHDVATGNLTLELVDRLGSGENKRMLAEM